MHAMKRKCMIKKKDREENTEHKNAAKSVPANFKKMMKKMLQKDNILQS